MPRITKAQQLYNELLATHGQKIADAFAAAVADLTKQADVQRLAAAVQAGDISAAIKALHLDPAAYGPLQDAIRAAYMAGGQAAAQGIPKLPQPNGTAAVIRFDGRNLRAEAWLADHSSKLVTNILDDQRLSLTRVLANGMAAGSNPRTVALDIVGRVNKATGSREGGIVGLTSTQEAYAATAQQELASGDPALLRNYLTRVRRDRRYDAAVKAAIKTEKPVPADLAGRAVRNYRNRQLALRGETIGKTEAFASLGASKHEAHKQASDATGIALQKVWRHFANEHPRTQHEAMDGKTAAADVPFILPDGTVMQYPHADDAPAGQVIGCHCQADYRFDFYANLR